MSIWIATAIHGSTSMLWEMGWDNIVNSVYLWICCMKVKILEFLQIWNVLVLLSKDK